MTRPDAVEYLQAGLRATGLRQTAIASNIANLQTPGFQRSVVAFEQAFAEALHGGQPGALEGLEASVLHPGGPLGDSGVNDVSLDQEVGDMVRNGAVSKTYLRLLGKLMKQMEIAIG
jgi:flagellar basal-body rod protein FlgB